MASARVPDVALAPIPDPYFVSSFPAATDRTQALLNWDPDIRRAARAAAIRFGRDRSYADDFAQEARIRLFNTLRRQPAAPAPYIRRVICNAVQSGVSATRQVSNHDSIDDVAEEFELDRKSSPSHADPIVILSVDQFIDRLPGNLRDIYDLLYVRGYTQQEAALRLGATQPRIAQLHGELLRRARYELGYVNADTQSPPLEVSAA